MRRRDFVAGSGLLLGAVVLPGAAAADDATDADDVAAVKLDKP